MSFEVGQIVKVRIPNGHVHGRVISVDQNGDGRARFASGANAVVSDIMPEMLVQAFYFEGKGRYGV